MYVLVDVVGADMWTDTFDDEDTAITSAEREWKYLSEHDKKRRTEFYVLKSVANDIDADDALDGDIIKRWK